MTNLQKVILLKTARYSVLFFLFLLLSNYVYELLNSGTKSVSLDWGWVINGTIFLLIWQIPYSYIMKKKEKIGIDSEDTVPVIAFACACSIVICIMNQIGANDTYLITALIITALSTLCLAIFKENYFFSIIFALCFFGFAGCFFELNYIYLTKSWAFGMFIVASILAGIIILGRFIRFLFIKKHSFEEELKKEL